MRPLTARCLVCRGFFSATTFQLMAAYVEGACVCINQRAVNLQRKPSRVRPASALTPQRSTTQQCVMTGKRKTIHHKPDLASLFTEMHVMGSGSVPRPSGLTLINTSLHLRQKTHLRPLISQRT
ncbi:uncharacterized protein KZ484_023227 isoform 1-T2 [Pholidichthys leucotaenia]